MKRTDLDRLHTAVVDYENAPPNMFGMRGTDRIKAIETAIAEIRALRKVAELGSKVAFDDYHSFHRDNRAFEAALDEYNQQFTDE